MGEHTWERHPLAAPIPVLNISVLEADVTKILTRFYKT